MKKSKGFTLIELLVVIAIIGILAAVLMVNLSSTRNKAKDAAVKLEMNQIRTAVESFALGAAGTYTGACTADTDCDTLETGIKTKVAAASEVEGFPAAGTSWCVQYTLNESSTTYWCVDSTGYAGAPTAVGTCTSAVGGGKCK